MKKFLLIAGLLIGINFLWQSLILAKNLEEEVGLLNKRVCELEKKSDIFPDIEGLNICLGATFIAQSAIDVNNTNTKDENITDASYSIDLGLEKNSVIMAWLLYI